MIKIHSSCKDTIEEDARCILLEFDVPGIDSSTLATININIQDDIVFNECSEELESFVSQGKNAKDHTNVDKVQLPPGPAQDNIQVLVYNWFGSQNNLLVVMNKTIQLLTKKNTLAVNFSQ